MPRYRRRKIKRATMGKEPIKHSLTLVATHGQGSAVQVQKLLRTFVGDRSLDGSAQTIQSEANTSNMTRVGDVVKYINVLLQSAITDAGVAINSQGWIEWAIVWSNQAAPAIPSTNLGTTNLGVIANRMFRGDCLMTGCFPVSVNLPNTEKIILKLPEKAVKQKIGNELNLFFHYRSATSTDVDTTSTRTISSALYKVYS